MSTQVVLDTSKDASRRRRIDKVSSTDLNSGSPSEEEFDSICSVSDTTETDDRNLDSVTNLPDHAESDRLDSRAREPARDRRQHRPATFGVDSHPEESIDKRDRISASRFDSASDSRDIRDIRSQLDHQVLTVDLSYRIDHLGSHIGLVPKPIPPFLTLGQEILSSIAATWSS